VCELARIEDKLKVTYSAALASSTRVSQMKNATNSVIDTKKGASTPPDLQPETDPVVSAYTNRTIAAERINGMSVFGSYEANPETYR
jgi:hypothetical protein